MLNRIAMYTSTSALQRLRDDLGEDEPRLERIVDHPRQNLTGLHLGEIAEREVRKVTVNGVAKVTRNVLLERRAELASNPYEQVLEYHRDQDQDDHVPQRVHLVAGHDPAADGGVEELRDPPRLHRRRRLVKQDVEERDQQGDREAVEQRRDEVRHDRDRHAPEMRAQERKKPLIDRHCPRYYRRFGAAAFTGAE